MDDISLRDSWRSVWCGGGGVAPGGKVTDGPTPRGIGGAQHTDLVTQVD
jgi:hypothetical protein